MTKRILIWGPAPWGNSGYCRVVANLGPRLAKHYEIAYFSYSHIVATPGLQWEGCPVFSGTHEWLGGMRHFVPNVVASYKPDLVLQVFDLFTAWPALKKYVKWPLVSYSPLDSALSQVQKECAELCSVVVPTSNFGKKAYEEGGIKTTGVIYHGADRSIYYPKDRAEARATLCLPLDTFIVLMVMDNTRRKNIPAQIRAFQNFQRETRAKAQLVGVIPNMPAHREWDLDLLWSHLRRDGEDECFQHTFGLSEESLSRFYSASDVLLQCSFSEGFGLPVVEAAACGIPTIATNFGSLPELVKGRGWLVAGEVSYCQPFFNTWQMVPSLKGMTEALIDAYEHPGQRQEYGQAMLKFVAGECDWDRLVEEKWLKIL